MDREPVVVDESARDWQTWPEEEVAQRGLIDWKTLVSGDVTRSEALTMGIAKIPPAGTLHEHSSCCFRRIRGLQPFCGDYGPGWH